MKDKHITFRFAAKTLKAMDRLITNPPAIAKHEKRGNPRNRTELIEMLMENLNSKPSEVEPEGEE